MARTVAGEGNNGRGHPAPYVVLDVDLRQGAFELVLVNIGGTPAHNVRVELSKPLAGLGGEVELSKLPIFRRLGVLRPDQEIRIFVDRAAAVLRRRQDRFAAKVTYRDDSGNTSEKLYRHDLGAFRGLPQMLED